VIRYDELPVLETTEDGDNRIRVDLVSTDLFATTDVLAYKVTYRPGDRVREHFHGDAKHYIFCLEGSGIVHTPKGDVEITAGDVATIDVGERHSLTNPNEVDLTFIEICLPKPMNTVWTDPDYMPGWVESADRATSEA
jgi:mannose-6-phosphate isomerase-like protein (cupin superfamily)